MEAFAILSRIRVLKWIHNDVYLQKNAFSVLGKSAAAS